MKADIEEMMQLWNDLSGEIGRKDLWTDFIGGEEKKQTDDAESQAEEEIQKELEDIVSGRMKVPVTYKDPDQSPLYGFEAQVMRHKWCSNMDYLPAVMTHLSDWLVNIYLGNYDYFAEQIDSLSPEEVKKKLNERETMLQVGAIFHVVIGARALFPGSPVMPALEQRFGKNIGMQHFRIMQRLVELGAEVNVHDVAGYTPLQHCLTVYGNKTTLALAQLLLRHGANPNARDRFGDTPIFECLLGHNVEHVELLIKYGARYDITDNEGCKVLELAVSSPEMMKILKQGDEVEIKNERKTAKATKGFKQCPQCKAKEAFLKCTGCYIEFYCSKPCQREHWPNHKEACKMRKAEFLSIKLEKESAGTSSMINKQPGKVFPPSETDKKVNGHFVVKVQSHVNSTGAMLVHNKDRSVNGFFRTDTPTGKIIFNVVATKGFKQRKGYFNVIKKNDEMWIHPEVLPHEAW